MHSEGDRVTDDAGVAYTLGSRIAKGGQGAVYRVAGLPDHAIKLLTRPEELAAIDVVRRLPLDGLSIAPPITLIRQGGAGYVMRLAGDMTPLSALYLPFQVEASATPQWYVDSGGLRRRLAIAARTADTLTRLHSLGLAYVDLNPNNVMVSDDLSADETWLIDTDNLTSMSTPHGNIGFPGYTAPERSYRGQPPSTLADAYSLSVLVFQLLVLTHPLRGMATEDLDGGTADALIDWGELPYVDDPTVGSNRLGPSSLASALLPLVLSGRMRKLCQQALGPGRQDQAQRPGSARWREVLHSALDNAIPCRASCGWSYFRNALRCPLCGAQNEGSFLLTIYGGDYDQPGWARDTVALATDGATPLLPRHVWGRYDEREPLLTLVRDGKGFVVETHGGVTIRDEAERELRFLHAPPVGQVQRARLDASGAPSRVLGLRWVAPR